MANALKVIVTDDENSTRVVVTGDPALAIIEVFDGTIGERVKIVADADGPAEKVAFASGGGAGTMLWSTGDIMLWEAGNTMKWGS